MNFPYPVLVCDVGGTNARFAVAAAPGAPLTHLQPQLTRAHGGLAQAARQALTETELKPASLIACVAGPVREQSARLTNADWILDGAGLAADLGLAQGLLLNDFEAQALSLPALREADCTAIGGGRAVAGGTQLILGPGTGLGLAGLVQVGGRSLSLPAEAGHVGFGPEGREEETIWPYLSRVEGRITAEALISGPGLARLHAARLAARGVTATLLDGAEVTRAALADPRGEAAATVRLFWRLLARFSGDMALVFLARGGVTFAGGVLPRILPLLDPVDFRAAFEAKAPMEAIVAAIPVRLIVAENTVLAGMAAIAATPEAYVIDYGRRRWR